MDEDCIQDASRKPGLAYRMLTIFPLGDFHFRPKIIASKILDNLQKWRNERWLQNINRKRMSAYQVMIIFPLGGAT